MLRRHTLARASRWRWRWHEMEERVVQSVVAASRNGIYTICRAKKRGAQLVLIISDYIHRTTYTTATRQNINRPPLPLTTLPVTHRLSSEHKKLTSGAMSRTSPTRASAGVLSIMGCMESMNSGVLL